MFPIEHEEGSDTEHVDDDDDKLRNAYLNHPMMKAEPGMAKPGDVAKGMARPVAVPSKKTPTAVKSLARPSPKQQAMAPMPKDSRDELIEKLQALESSCLKDFLAHVCNLTEIVLQKLFYFVVDCLKAVS